MCQIRLKGLNVDTSNDIAKNKIKDFKSIILKWVNKFNKYVKQDTNNNNNNNNNNNDNDSNNNEPDIKQATCDDIKGYIIDKQKLIKKDITV